MSQNFVDHSRTSTFTLLKMQCNVMVALMLRDIKSRFFGTAWGFLLALAWPLTHIMVLLFLNSLSGRLPPYGESSALWFATGIVPFMAFSYMSRFIMLGIVHNRPLLVFPLVKIMDILLSRAIIEVLSAGTVILILITLALIFGVPFWPPNVTEAFFALGAAFLLGLGTGVINAIIAQAMPFWVTIFILWTIVLWIISGVFFVPENLPAGLRILLEYNPVLQSILWFRSAYYEGYGETMLSKTYVLSYGAISLFGGLALERLVRGRLLQG